VSRERKGCQTVPVKRWRAHETVRIIREEQKARNGRRETTTWREKEGQREETAEHPLLKIQMELKDGGPRGKRSKEKSLTQRGKKGVPVEENLKREKKKGKREC